MSFTLSGLTVFGNISAKISSPATYTAFDTSTVWNNAVIKPAFSNNNLTSILPHAAFPIQAGQVRSAHSFSTGRIYTEVRVDSKGGNFYPLMGIIQASYPTSQSVPASGAGFAWWGGPSPQLHGQVTGLYGTAWNVGDVIGILVDFNLGTLVFYKNGISMGIARAALPAEPYHIWVRTAGNGYPATVTANFGATPFAYPVAGATGILET